MQRLFTIFFLMLVLTAKASTPDFVNNFSPFSFEMQGFGHVQGIAVDTTAKCAYISLTTALVKTDLQGNVLGSVTGFQGHLGCITFNPADGCVYASLEFKSDAIGKGINKATGRTSQTDAFYVAIFNGNNITRTGISCEDSSALTATYLPTVVNDYEQVVNGNKGRYGCSGIDGISIGPAFNSSAKPRRLLTVAYGITPDNSRSDNDHQVLLQYSIGTVRQNSKPLRQHSLHTSGPAKPLGKYFVYTGNTSWGIQNLAYDAASQLWFMLTYRGSKPNFPNSTLYVAKAGSQVSTAPLKGVVPAEKAPTVSLLRDGVYHAPSGVFCFEFKYGTCGFAPIGGKYYLVSQPFSHHNGKIGTTLHLYRFTGHTPCPFTLVK